MPWHGRCIISGMSDTKASTLPVVRALRVRLNSSPCTVADCTCGHTLPLTFHDPRDASRLAHDLCTFCGSDVYADVFHVREEYVRILHAVIRKENAVHASNVARKLVRFVRKNRGIFATRDREM